MAEASMFQEAENRLRRLSLLRDSVRMEYEEAFAALPGTVRGLHSIGQQKGDPSLWETLAAKFQTPEVNVCRHLSASLQQLINACSELEQQIERADPAHTYNLSLKKKREGIQYD